MRTILCLMYLQLTCIAYYDRPILLVTVLVYAFHLLSCDVFVTTNRHTIAMPTRIEVIGEISLNIYAHMSL